MFNLNRSALSFLKDRIISSAVFMSWVALLVRVGGLAFLLPLVVTELPVETVVVWYVFTTITSLVIIMDFGFSPTLSRLYGYAHGGASISEIAAGNFCVEKSTGYTTESNQSTILSLRLFGAKAYLMLAFGCFLVAGLIGSLALVGPMAAAELGLNGWLAWLVVLIISSLQLYVMRYSVELQGSNRIAEVQSRQAVTSLLALISASLSLVLGLGFLAFVVAFYIWPLVYFYSIRKCFNKKKISVIGGVVEPSSLVWLVAWPPIWKSGIGMLMSIGLIQASGVIYAQLAPATEVASYMIGLQLIRAISQFSQVPFYVKLPLFSRQYALGQVESILVSASKYMKISYLVYTCGFFVVVFFGEIVFDYIGSQVKLPREDIWALMGAAILVERYGAMHIQLYSLSNNIIWHIANGVTGGLMILLCVLLYPSLAVLAFPVSMLIAYVSFYLWYSVGHSYREFGQTFYGFDTNVFGPFALIFICWLFYNLRFPLIV